jgi:hypothetical protein
MHSRPHLPSSVSRLPQRLPSSFRVSRFYLSPQHPVLPTPSPTPLDPLSTRLSTPVDPLLTPAPSPSNPHSNPLKNCENTGKNRICSPETAIRDPQTTIRNSPLTGHPNPPVHISGGRVSMAFPRLASQSTRPSRTSRARTIPPAGIGPAAMGIPSPHIPLARPPAA